MQTPWEQSSQPVFPAPFPKVLKIFPETFMAAAADSFTKCIFLRSLYKHTFSFRTNLQLLLGYQPFLKFRFFLLYF